MSEILKLLQINNQMLCFLINKLGEEFELDESKIIKLEDLESGEVENNPEV